MATVAMVYPRDGGTYGTNEDGSLVPFVAYGYVDVPGQVVTIYEDATSALLGSVAANATPEPSGTWAGWYRWEIPVASWTTAAGALVPVMAGKGAMAIPSLAGTHPILTMAGTGAMADTSYTSATVFAVPTLAGKGALGVPGPSGALGVPVAAGLGALSSVSITAVLGLPVMAGLGAVSEPSITSSDATGPTISSFTVPSSDTDTSITGISAGATDNVGVTGWVIKDVAGGAGAPTATAGECSLTTGISGGALSSSALTHTVGGTGARDCYLFARDAAGNVTRSSVSTVTVSTGSEDRWIQGQHSGGGATSTMRLRYVSSPASGYQTAFSRYETEEGSGVFEWEFALHRYNNGNFTQLEYLILPDGMGPWFRLEAQGAVIRFRSATSSSGPWTTQVSHTDASPILTGGASSAFGADLSNVTSGSL